VCGGKGAEREKITTVINQRRKKTLLNLNSPITREKGYMLNIP